MTWRLMQKGMNGAGTAMTEVPACERSIRTGGLMRCCLETIRTSEAKTMIGDKLTCKWCREDIVVGEDGAWRWPALPQIPGFSSDATGAE